MSEQDRFSEEYWEGVASGSVIPDAEAWEYLKSVSRVSVESVVEQNEDQ